MIYKYFIIQKKEFEIKYNDYTRKSKNLYDQNSIIWKFY